MTTLQNEGGHKISERRVCRGGCGRKLNRANRSGYCRSCFGKIVLRTKGVAARKMSIQDRHKHCNCWILG